MNKRVIDLQCADMTHEYNNAEAERAWPQIKQQIIDEAIEGIKPQLEYWKQRCEAAEVVLKTFPREVLSDQAGEDYNAYEQLKAQEPKG